MHVIVKPGMDIQKAIDSLPDGGEVLFSEGVFHAKPLRLHSNISLMIPTGSTIIASGDIDDYPADVEGNRYRNEPELNRCFIYAEHASHISIEGDGIIDGNNLCFPNEGSAERPMLMRFFDCDDVTLLGMTLLESASWTTAFLDCTNIRVSQVNVRNSRRYNGDGFDFDDCRNVRVVGCTVDGTDDNLCIQSSGKVAEDIVVLGCTFSSICAGVRIGLKSVGTIRNVLVSDSTFRHVMREGVKIECSEGGTISDIGLSHLTMEDVRRPLFLLLNNRYEPEGLGSSLSLDHMPEIGTMEHISISDLVATESEAMGKAEYRFDHDLMGSPLFWGIKIDANVDHPIRDVEMENITYKPYGGVREVPQDYPQVVDLRLAHPSTYIDNYFPSWSRAFVDIRNVKGLSLSGLSVKPIHPDCRPPVLQEGCAS
jgi:hypothetical protein